MINGNAMIDSSDRQITFVYATSTTAEDDINSKGGTLLINDNSIVENEPNRQIRLFLQDFFNTPTDPLLEMEVNRNLSKLPLFAYD